MAEARSATPKSALLTLAWRGVRAHSRRTAVLVAAGAMGLVAVAFSLGMQRWSHETLMGLTSDGAHGLGHVERPGYHRTRDPALRFAEDPPPVDPGAANVRGERWTAMLEWPALASGPRDQAPVRLQGIHEGFRTVAVGSRESLASPATVPEVVVGADLASRLGVADGARLALRYRNAAGADRTAHLVARVAAKGASSSSDRFTLALPLDQLQALIGERSLTGWGIAFPGVSDRGALLVRLAATRAALRDPALELVTWRETAPDVEGITEVQTRAVYMLIVILVLVQTIGVANAFVLGLVDRTRELGVLLALGLEPLELRELVRFEAWLTSAAGTVAGLVLCAPLAWWLRHHGLDFSGSARTMEVAGQVLPPVVRAYIGPLEIGCGAVLSSIVGPLAGWWPARRIARLDPVAALRAV